MADSSSASRLRAFFLNLLTVGVSLLVALLLLEAGLRFMPVAWAPPVVPPSADNPIQRYQPNTPFTWSIGWNFAVVNHGRTNAQGFVADYDYDAAARTPLVAVLGDSYVEALMVPFRETLTGRLQAALGDKGRAYAIAQAGSPLSQYVAYAQHACAVYRPQRVVVVVVGNDFDESVFAHRARDGIHHLYPKPEGGFDFRLTPPRAPGLLGTIARHSALALYVARTINIVYLLHRCGAAQAQAPQQTYVGNTSASASAARLAEGEAVIDWFVGALAKAACLAPKDIVLAVDAMRPQIYDPASLAPARETYYGRMRASLIAKAAGAGYKVVDMEGPMRAAYERDRQLFEHPMDGHWNARGHAVAAEAVRAALSDWEPLAR
jgi:hypothetical protein